MKNWKIILVMLMFLIGCNAGPDKDALLLDKYEAAYSDLLSNDKFIVDSSFYDIEIAVNKIENNRYRVDAIIDNPKVAMYNVQVITEINSVGIEQFEEAVPSLGIVDQSVYHLIPYQVNKEEGFYAGLVVSGVSDKPKGDIILSIAWTDYAETESNKEYLELSYDVDGEEDIEEDSEAAEEEIEEGEDE